MDIVLKKAESCNKDILFRLIQYSLFEESISDGNNMNEQALFEYPWFDAYFTDNDREAYFVREQETNQLLGFALINTYVQKCDSGHSIAEFMILPKFRRNGLGKKAAGICFDKYRGNWEVSPSVGSTQAYCFWKHVIDEYTAKKNSYADGIFSFSVCEREG